MEWNGIKPPFDSLDMLWWNETKFPSHFISPKLRGKIKMKVNNEISSTSFHYISSSSYLFKQWNIISLSIFFHFILFHQSKHGLSNEMTCCWGTSHSLPSANNNNNKKNKDEPLHTFFFLKWKLFIHFIDKHMVKVKWVLTKETKRVMRKIYSS